MEPFRNHCIVVSPTKNISSTSTYAYNLDNRHSCGEVFFKNNNNKRNSIEFQPIHQDDMINLSYLIP